MKDSTLIPAGRIERRILFLRAQKVMLDFQLAELYEVETRTLNQAVRRNAERFPEDFVFQLTKAETEQVMQSPIVTSPSLHSSQTGMSSPENGPKAQNTTSDMRSQSVIASEKRNIRFRPYAFTEQGVVMLSSVLRRPRAALEEKYDEQFKVVFEAIRELMEPDSPAEAARREIGFHVAPPSTGARSRLNPRKRIT